MAKHHAFVLVGPSIPAADELIDELSSRSELLGEAALALPKVTQADLFRSSVELLRTHKAESMRRADVEGSWARVCRKAEKTKADVLFGMSSYVAASPEQIALMLDGLAAFRTHIIITTERGSEGIDELIEPWTQAVKASRLHVLTLEKGDDLDVLLGRVLELARDTRTADLERRILKLKEKRVELKDKLKEIRAS
jgi:hypothetical protein